VSQLTTNTVQLGQDQTTDANNFVLTAPGDGSFKISAGVPGNTAAPVFEITNTGNTTVSGNIAITGNLNVTGATTLSDLDFNDPVFSGNVTVQAQGDVRFADSDSSNFVALQAPATVASNVVFTLPGIDASGNGDCLVSDASGNFSFSPRASTGKAIAMSIVFG
jgi:hypothetical protein